MKGWLSIVLSLFLAFGVTAGAMAHAAEPGVGKSEIASIDACGGFSKKSDDSQSDPSKMSVKFHGCHGHHIGIPVASAPEIERIAPVRFVPLRNRAGLAPPTHSDTFRPPIA
ncbi:hypothetical protein [Sphingopyxis alaskensis]|jgi:hypothetical protein|uniref:Uncharacterized protein n=1 Tax=Sphingopyxis alaskensis (strain DSM 13593 / LMG 18877 / RB2256) TaxID=317655 RepID=Q1GPZ0_SPHAL|nr:hypothetical protein [Sphingopyxis alaskensis]ABF54282.1 hypothetical protein Sala_2576 [Sphingopyxis alaskensis RB2256]MCM3418007.1 hypothetical protein [Sphingopyxis alaskensis]